MSTVTRQDAGPAWALPEFLDLDLGGTGIPGEGRDASSDVDGAGGLAPRSATRTVGGRRAVGSAGVPIPDTAAQIVVRRLPASARSYGAHEQHAGRFLLRREGGRTVVLHTFRVTEVDDDLGDAIAHDLIRPGLLPGDPCTAFEAVFVGVVASLHEDPAVAWRAFYANTIRALLRPPTRQGTGAVATFAPIYRLAAGLVVGHRVLDVGSCFGFFPLLLGRDPSLRVTGSDLLPGTAALASRMAADRGSSVRFEPLDITTRTPHRAGAFDTVTMLHVLEHLPARMNRLVLHELTRLAARRVVVAVPLERTPDPAYGHRQAFDADGLLALARGLRGWHARTATMRGGWLVLDRKD
ncbi:mycofactocin oligosaccharide methyltransferase MftM [Patulibacter minatonensis]|uniref:mycofactocin oligosaccharide methyltransferase MftM n=1 Tax=Patulibacter minatonensis TaxID=298163 RepID=UPI0004B5A718|nr:mycofactocin oligosaccharide methyltransferase MftM [Patulibacter minatonensis]